MDPVARSLLQEARDNYSRFGFRESPILQIDEHAYIVAIRYGTVKATTLAFALGSWGFIVEQHDGFLVVDAADTDCSLPEAFRKLAAGQTPDLFAHAPNLIFEKFHSYLTQELLKDDAMSNLLDIGALRTICAEIML